MNFCLRRLTVRTPGFHPGNGSSILPGDANKNFINNFTKTANLYYNIL
jgi:hypothetical protein